jgi:hypothetical protein
MKPNKKRVSKILLLVDYNNLEKNDRVQALETIKDRLRILAPSIIGEANSISPVELFEKILGKEAITFDVYRRKFYYDIIKQIAKHLRSSGEIFFIFKQSKIFVLESEEELEKFKTRIDHDIDSLEKLKMSAEEWVKYKKYKKLKKMLIEGVIA